MEKTINGQSIFHLFDHTLLSVTATIDDIGKLCGEAVTNGAGAVCVPPCYVAAAKQFLAKSKVRICTVIGYPNGYAATAVKLFECKNAIKSGADEFEIYANIGYIKKRRYDDMQSELTAIRKLCKKNTLKLVIDTSVLNADEQIAVCTIAASSLIDYITIVSGADLNGLESSLRRFKDVIGERAKLKIAGGLTTLADAQRLIDAGASRIGETDILSQPYAPVEVPEEIPAAPLEVPDTDESIEAIAIPEEEVPVEIDCFGGCEENMGEQANGAVLPEDVLLPEAEEENPAE